MKLVYLTSQKYPSGKVDPLYWRSMAESFNQMLGSDFIFVVRGKADGLQGINTLSIAAPDRYRAIYYFLLFPLFIRRYGWNDKEVHLFSADSYLLSIAILWRKFLHYKYSIISDWHQLFEDWRDRYIAYNSDLLITTTDTLKREILKHNTISINKIEAVHGGIDHDTFRQVRSLNKEECRNKLDLSRDRILIGYAGGFRVMGMEKGVNTMVKALPYLGSEIQMVFVGGRQDEITEYQHLATTLGVSGRCNFVGRKNFETTLEYEAAMDILVIANPDTAYFRNQCFPLKVWEYLASGRPIIYSDLEVMNEVLIGRGSSFRPNDPESLSQTINSVLMDRVREEERGRRNAEEAEKYTWQARTSKILGHINKLRHEER